MVSRIIRHEWRQLSSDATLWLVTAACVVAIGYGVWNGARWVRFQQGALADTAAEQGARYDALRAQIDALAKPGAKVSPFADPRSPSNLGGRLAPKYASLPPAPLAAVAIGQSDLLPYYFKVTTDARENIVSATEIENPNRLLAGRFDLAFVIIYFLPLLILALTYNMVSAEKEQGTLALVLSQPVSTATLVRGKVALRGALLLGVLVLLSAAALLITGADLAVPGAAARLLMWIAAVAAYAAFWFGLSIFVTSLGRASTANATILATTWLALVVMAPSLFNLIATSVYPVPSRVELVQAVREASDEANKAGSQLLARYYEDHPELATGDAAQAMTDFNVVRVAVNDDVENRVRPVVQRHERQIAAQQATLHRLQFLSPAILMQNALNDIAGSGTARHQHFLAQVDAFHAAWRGHFVPLIFAKAQVNSLDTLPSFAFVEEPIVTVWRRVAGAAGALLLPAFLLAWAGFRRLPRFPVAG
jgi:ABC-2 type transport system permease protein